MFPTGKIALMTAVSGTRRMRLKDVLDMAISELQLLKPMKHVASAAVAATIKLWLLVLAGKSLLPLDDCLYFPSSSIKTFFYNKKYYL